ncbi:hypothetical protein A2U01_0037292, partial [Trifolium medium]|nr:hypothetical protein [Trifolium medium]
MKKQKSPLVEEEVLQIAELARTIPEFMEVGVHSEFALLNGRFSDLIIQRSHTQHLVLIILALLRKNLTKSQAQMK